MGQTGKNIQVNFEVEGTFNVNPAGTGKRLLLNASPGLTMTRPDIQPGTIRADQLTPMGRLGSRSVGGSYDGDVTVGAFDEFWEAVSRGTFVAAVVITQSEMTSITTTATTIVAAAGSWITEGVKVGDIVRLTNHSTAANNNINLRVVTVTASTLTLGGTAPLTVDAAPDATFELTILKKVSQPAVPVERTFHIEEYNVEIDQSELFGGCKCDGFTITGTPDNMAVVTFPFVGASVDPLATGSSPNWASPTVPSNLGLLFLDATIRLNGVDVATPTAFEITASLSSQTLPVLGSTVTPDIFADQLTMEGSISLLREDLQRITDFEAETEYELHIVLQEPASQPAPRKVFSLFMPRIKLSGVDAPLGQPGAMVETLPFMVGAKVLAATYDATMFTICTET